MCTEWFKVFSQKFKWLLQKVIHFCELFLRLLHIRKTKAWQSLVSNNITAILLKEHLHARLHWASRSTALELHSTSVQKVTMCLQIILYIRIVKIIMWYKSISWSDIMTSKNPYIKA